MLRTVEGRCKECYACIRVCPVKAIRTTSGKAEALSERCIRCGQCVVACTQGALDDTSDLEVVRQLLSSGKLVVTALAAEFPAAFSAAPNALEPSIERAGFYSVEELILGEEVVATEYERLLRGAGETVIRSTCPAVVNFIEKYHPSLVDKLARIPVPAVAQGRLIKEFYGDVAVVYVGPCFAMKGVADASEAIDAALTFKELKQLLHGAEGETAATGATASKPRLKRSKSLPGGLPRSFFAGRVQLDADVKVARGLDELRELAAALEAGEAAPAFIDVLACDGCIDGPGIDSPLSIYVRKALVARVASARESSARTVSYGEVERLMPPIRLEQEFLSDDPHTPKPTVDEIHRAMAAAEMIVEADELDCGGCGYATCREMAEAVCQGLAVWSMCFPYQRKIFERTVHELKESSATDGLTGLPNHKHFEERLASEFHRARRYAKPLSLVMIDVDNFKSVNDSFGHLGGNRFLRSIARLIKESVRQSDFAARYGGDEFVVILPETDDTEAFAVGEKLRRQVEGRSINLGSGGAETTFSLGISSLAPDVKRPTDLIERADQALYEAKRTGKNKTCLAGG